MKLLYKIVKKMVLALCLIYSLNLIIGKTGILVPINYYTIVTVMFLGIPGLIGIIVLLKLI